jgi:hypothetical protein
MILFLLLVLDTGLSSTSPIHLKGAGKHVVGLETLLQNRRRMSDIGDMHYCAYLGAECLYNNQLQRLYGAGNYLQERRVVVASDRVWPIDIFFHVLCEEPGYSMAMSPKVTRWGAHYDGHFWTVVFK